MGKPSPARSPLLSSYGSRLYRDGTSPHRLPRRPSRPAHRAFGPSQSFRGRHARIPGAPPKRRARRLFGRAGAFRCPGILEICSHAGGKPCAAAADQGTTEAAHTSSPSRARRSARTCRERCGGGERAWIGARDLAILLLLYGAGLRVAEALSLTGRTLPVGATLRVTGKRSKTRVVPVVPAVREAIEDYVRQCPYPISGDAALFVGARGGHSILTSCGAPSPPPGDAWASLIH